MVYGNDIPGKNLAPLKPSINLAQSDDNQVVYTVRQLILDAVRCGVFDIHIEPRQYALQIRQRLDGFMPNQIPTTGPRTAADFTH